MGISIFLFNSPGFFHGLFPKETRLQYIETMAMLTKSQDMQYCSSRPYNVKDIHYASSFGGKNLHAAWEQWLTSSKYCVIYRQQHQGDTQRSLPIGTPTNIVKEC